MLYRQCFWRTYSFHLQCIIKDGRGILLQNIINLEGAICVGIATVYGLDGWVRFPGGESFFIFSTASIPALGPTQVPIQWVSRAVPPPEVTRLEHEADHSSHLLQGLRMMQLYVHSPMCFHGVVLNELSTRTTLPF
jgi:hypothetical protein